MKNILLLMAMIFPIAANASDLTSKVECTLNFEEITYVDHQRVVKAQPIPVVQNHYNTYPPRFYWRARYVDTSSTKERAVFVLHMQDNLGAIAISFSKDTPGESVDLVSLRLNPKDSLDLELPVAPPQGPTWDQIIKVLHLVCKPKA